MPAAAFPRAPREAQDARRAPGMGSAGRPDLPADYASGPGGYARATGYRLLVRLFFRGVSEGLVFGGHVLRLGVRSGPAVPGLVFQRGAFVIRRMMEGAFAVATRFGHFAGGIEVYADPAFALERPLKDG